jgi:hypothetical protein
MKSITQSISILVLALGLSLAALSSQLASAQEAQSSQSKNAVASAKDFIDPISEGPARTVAVETRTVNRYETRSETHVETYAETRSETRYGLGLASAYNLTASDAALTGWIGLTPKFGIQPLLSIGSTSPFNISAGALAKYTVAQHGAGGFHLGGGMSLGSIHDRPRNGGLLFGNVSGTKSGFNMALTALAGVHYEMPNTNIVLHFDGGANFGLADGDTDFNLGAVGGLLGASIIYIF